MYQNRKPAVWKSANDMFQVSENGAIKPDATFQGFMGTPSFITQDTLRFILANVDSARQALEASEANTKGKELSKILSKHVAVLVAAGLTEEEAIAVAKRKALENAKSA